MARDNTFPVPIGIILGRSARRFKLGDKMKTYSLWRRWHAIAGPEVASHTEPVKWAGRTLVVRTKSHAWVQELTFLKPKLLERIRQAEPDTKISDIRFECGAVSDFEAPGRNAFMPNSKPLNKDELDFIETAAREIKDESVRECAEKAMLKGFSRTQR